MQMNKALLITRPNHDPGTNYLFYWAGEVILMAQRKRVAVLDLSKDKATKKNFDSYLKRNQPKLIFLNGHGYKDSILGFNDEPLISMNKDDHLLNGKIIYARSCDAARELGTSAVQKGALAFIGYIKSYRLGYSPSSITRPLQDKIAELFLIPSNLIPISILKGNSTGHANSNSLKAMRRNFRFMLSSNASPAQRDAARHMWHNIQNQKLLGNDSAKL